MQPETKYAKSGDVHIAYQVVGEGPIDLVLNFGYISHVELVWEGASKHLERLASFSRLILFDKRGVGMSDPVDNVPTFEDRMEDLHVVMDAAGSTEAVILGISEGAAMAMLFAATYPERTKGLVIYGGVARSTWAPDFPWPPTREGLEEAAEWMLPYWGQGTSIEIFAPSVQGLPSAREAAARLERQGASPGMAKKLFGMFLDVDVRDALPSISAPTLVIHRKGDRVINIRAARWTAEHITGAKLVELDGIDHNPWVGDVDAIIDEVESFVTGARATREPDRVLRTVMFTDIVGSTERAAALGDATWRQVLDAQHALTRVELERFQGKEIKTLGDGFLATFDGPARAVRCAHALIQASEKDGSPLRIGLHTGECELMDDGDVGGIAVHIAARIASLAGSGEVLVSRTVTDLVTGSGLTFTERGRHPLKGVTGEWELFASD